MQSIQHLRDIFRQAQVAHASGTVGQLTRDTEGRVPDARYFDKQVGLVRLARLRGGVGLRDK